MQQATSAQAHLEQQLGLASARVTQAHKVLAAVKGEAERWGVAGAEMEDKHQQVGGRRGGGAESRDGEEGAGQGTDRRQGRMGEGAGMG